MLGLDPLYVANEGKLIAVVPAKEVDRVLDVMRGHPLGRNAAIIGEVVDEHAGLVIVAIGRRRRAGRYAIGRRAAAAHLLAVSEGDVAAGFSLRMRKSAKRRRTQAKACGYRA